MNSVPKFDIKNTNDFEEKPLDEILRNGARKMLQAASELQVQEYCDNY